MKKKVTEIMEEIKKEYTGDKIKYGEYQFASGCLYMIKKLYPELTDTADEIRDQMDPLPHDIY